MSLIKVQNLTYAYPGSYDNIFENVSFSLDTDWRLGFTGRNGRGKTTFLRLLTGELQGTGTISASVRFEYFPFRVSDPSLDSLSAALAVNPELSVWELQREMAKLGLSDELLGLPFLTLSNGERTKLMLALLFIRENGFPLIDEPTNHLDDGGRELAAKYLASKRGFILVSHDRAFLDASVDHILSINRADIEVQSGNFSSWYYNKQLRDSSEQAENERLKKDIRRLEESARQSAKWADKAESTKIGFDPRVREKSIGIRAYAGEQSRRMQQRRKNLERRQTAAIEEKSSLLKNVEEAEPLKLSPLTYHSPRRLAEARDLCLFCGDRKICGPLSFTLRRGDRLALAGRNGSGKSSLIKLLLGAETPLSPTGKLTVASGLKISYVPQDASGLSGPLDGYAESAGIDRSLFLAILRKLDFSRLQFEKDMSSYSEGQKKKVLIARSLCESAHLYVWDEPLNYIDILSRIQIEELLTDFRPTLLFVDHDRAFRSNIATDTVLL